MKKYLFTILLSLFSLIVITTWVSGYDNKGFLFAITDFIGTNLLIKSPKLDEFYMNQSYSVRMFSSSLIHFISYFSLGLIIDIIRNWFKSLKT
ncbi:hypothetical protein [Enterococcus faecalis]|uniref:hypothetical protein n=1 Tax=Enterococcus faecalis TaxID=1351 RepID=UPI0003529938|nr:hypothetical protein [Enterococcus faecalis]EPH73398.1 hypothetical protein D928_00319 [Enterococcus faecalis 20-SD-BW-06]EPI01621.1 hypothetical protein D919_01401 [Enterococcus faecalis 20-SD-BW-08]EGO8565244.1 hypothetical protein [Enterococcus faecalis]EGO8625379.1 hypothetical protein [Enterococcus faecalis]MBA1329516.1 hypothetical protein [Enterococcus faecalis]